MHPPILPVSRSSVKIECVRVGLWASPVERRTEIDSFVTVSVSKIDHNFTYKYVVRPHTLEAASGKMGGGKTIITSGHNEKHPLDLHA